MMKQGTGVVIGETARVGSNCTILHGVTLGSVGKPSAASDDVCCPKKHDDTSNRRHPIVGNNVQIGCNAAILGAICIGDGAKVGSSSVVLKSVPARCTAVGSPARIIGRSHTTTGADGERGDTYTEAGAEDTTGAESAYSDIYLRTWTLWADCIHIFNSATTSTATPVDAPAGATTGKGVSVSGGGESVGRISLHNAAAAWASAIQMTTSDMPMGVLRRIFLELDTEHTGLVDVKQLEVAIIGHIRNIEDSYHYNYQI
jgi:hypothetical protein